MYFINYYGTTNFLGVVMEPQFKYISPHNLRRHSRQVLLLLLLVLYAHDVCENK